MIDGGRQQEALDWVLQKMAAKQPAASRGQPAAPPKPQLQASEKQDRAKQDLELWKTWKENGQTGEHFGQLAKRFAGTLHSKMNIFKGAEINPTIMKSHLYKGLWRTLDRYDPNHPSKASVNTWVNNNLNQLKRVVVYYQNTGRMSEPLVNKIGVYDSAVAELTEKLGYEPAIDQIAAHSKLPKKTIIALQQQRHAAHDMDGGGETAESAFLHTNDQVRYAAKLIHPILKPTEQKVHELIWPATGAPVFDSGTMAKKLGWHVSKVSKAKKGVLQKLMLYM